MTPREAMAGKPFHDAKTIVFNSFNSLNSFNS